MWIKIKYVAINFITNVFGTVGGVAELIEGYGKFEQGDVAGGIMKMSEGMAIFVIGYFVGKRGSETPA